MIKLDTILNVENIDTLSAKRTEAFVRLINIKFRITRFISPESKDSGYRGCSDNVCNVLSF